jgi:WD40 repeat protein
MRTASLELFRLMDASSDWVWSMAFSGRDDMIALGLSDGRLRVTSVAAGRPQAREIAGQTGRVRVVSFVQTGDGELLMSGGDDGTIRVWTLALMPLGEQRGAHPGGVRAIEAIPGDVSLASAGSDGRLRRWMLTDDGQLVPRGETSRLHAGIRCLELDGRGQRIFAGLETGEIVSVAIDGAARKSWQTHARRTWGLALSPAGRTLFSAGGDGIARAWDTGDLHLRNTYRIHSAPVTAVVAPADDRVITGGEDHSIGVWDADAPACLRIRKGYSNVLWSVAIDETRHILYSGSSDGVMRAWDYRTLECVGTFAGHTHWVRGVTLMPGMPA